VRMPCRLAVSQAGGLVLTEVIRTVGLDRELSEALRRWRRPLVVWSGRPADLHCDHTGTGARLAQLPTHRPGTRPGRRILVRSDAGRAAKG